MSSTGPPSTPVGPATLITVKVQLHENNRRFKIPLGDLGPSVLPQKLHQLLGIPADDTVIFERYSDSAGCHVLLDPSNPAVYKQLYRAAKAKLKLRIKATVPTSEKEQEDNTLEPQSPPRCNYLETVLGSPAVSCPANSTAVDSAALVPELPALVWEGSTPQDSTPHSSEPQPQPQVPSQSQDQPQPQEQSHQRAFVLNQDSLTVPMVSHHSADAGTYFIDCNACGRSISDEHYHCSICSRGDYDLCPPCVKSGATCPDETHWLIRRSVKDGVVINSTTETIGSQKSLPEITPQEPSPQVTPLFPAAMDDQPAKRICNSCVKELEESHFVSCQECEDHDLCINCLLRDVHGHHPAHTFILLGDRQFSLRNLVLSRCQPGRHRQHAAICDGCEKRIVGVRHKCLTCPDWDYCSDCHANAALNHRGHRFVPVYETIAEPPSSHEVHYGIFCDGPLCKDQPYANYIAGVRYKCSVCYDLDLCAKCEALPSNTHNRTHPMVMLKTPVRNVTVSTTHDSGAGAQPTTPASSRPQQSTSTQAPAPAPAPVPAAAESPILPVPDAMDVETQVPAPETTEPETDYQAVFVADTVLDGSTQAPNQVFQQAWTLRNSGSLAWPAGTDVRFVGGDSMFNVNLGQAMSLSSMSAAMETDKLTAPVAPGECATFTVTLKAPSRVGTAISYWRLKLPNGLPFGHRLWCDIQVREEEPPVVVPADEARSGSQMIFPKLEKESPETSTHAETEAAPTVPSQPSERDVLEEVESLTLDEDTETDLLTDDEYDILDASDQEYLDAKSASA